MSEYCKNCYELAEQLHNKEQECEKLKEINAEIQESEIELENMKNSLFIDYMKYKQAIEEIEKISKEAGNTEYLTFPDFNLKQNAKMLIGQFNGYLEQIIQKCEEVNK